MDFKNEEIKELYSILICIFIKELKKKNVWHIFLQGLKLNYTFIDCRTEKDFIKQWIENSTNQFFRTVNTYSLGTRIKYQYFEFYCHSSVCFTWADPRLLVQRIPSDNKGGSMHISYIFGDARTLVTNVLFSNWFLMLLSYNKKISNDFVSFLSNKK